MTKVGVYAIIRVYTLLFGENAGALANLGMDWVFPLALLTMIVGVIGMMGSGGLRTMVAWQVVVSVGTILAAFSWSAKKACHRPCSIWCTPPGWPRGCSWWWT